MHGVTGRKRVSRPSREGDAMPVPCDGQPVRPCLIEHGFQNMRQHGRCEGDHQDVIGNGAMLRMPEAGVKPSGLREREEHMFVGAPSHCLCGVLEA